MPDEPTPPPRTAEPPVLDARTLRLLAEAADGRRGEDYAIFYDDSGYAVSPESRTGGTKLVRVRTEPNTPRRRRVRDLVHLQMPGTGIQPLDSEVDAIFWSEAAVEKFVLPYYQRLLTRTDMQALLTAHDSENVVAILHIKPSIYRQVSAAAEIGVARVSGDKGQLEIMGLLEWAKQMSVAEPDRR